MASTVVGNVECFHLIGQFSLCEKKIGESKTVKELGRIICKY